MDEQNVFVRPINLELAAEHWHPDGPRPMDKVDEAAGEVITNEPNWARNDYACPCGERVSVHVTVQIPPVRRLSSPMRHPGVRITEVAPPAWPAG